MAVRSHEGEGGPTGNIFISYRREDSAAYAGRLCDHLNQIVGSEHVFMDVEDIAPGQRFAQKIDDTIGQCGAILVVVGPKWAGVLKQRAQVEQPDYVRREIEGALARGITVIPVLVGGASAAELEGLPGKLADLAQFEAAELRDGTFGEDCQRVVRSLGLGANAVAPAPSRGSRKVWLIAGALALLAVGAVAASKWMGVGPVGGSRVRNSAVRQQIATGKMQASRSDYESAFRTFQEIVKAHPANREAQDLLVDAAMGCVREFHVVAAEGQKAEDLAAAKLGELIPVLDAGLARVNGRGPRAADILAHSGWAHWLNQRIAAREFGPRAEQDLRESVRLGPANVYGNAMLAAWIVQSGRAVKDALPYFQKAVATRKDRPFVRSLQLGAFIYPRDDEARAALIQAADDMRRNGEAIEPGERRRILSSYSPTVNDAHELSVTLGAVPPADAWATYTWLDSGEGRDESRAMQGDFIHASLLEKEGKRQEALNAFLKLRADLQRVGMNGRIATLTANAASRLSH